MSELKPCPFCSTENQKISESYGLWTIKCLYCGIEQGFGLYSSKNKAIEAWNTRYERTINLKDAVEAIDIDICGDGYDAEARAENIVETIARMCGARVINE